jgi:hypothetical protein
LRLTRRGKSHFPYDVVGKMRLFVGKTGSLKKRRENETSRQNKNLEVQG